MARCEALAEKFHMSESCSILNAKSSFEAGDTIVVANIDDDVRDTKVAR